MKAASALARPAWLWEEGIPREWDAKVIWERKFKREVFKRIIQTLSRIGWTVGEQTHIFTDNNSRHCVKGDLQADLKICGRSIELELFQAVNTPDRADHSGRYQSDKEKHMPYLARLEMQRTRIRIRDYLAGGAALEPRFHWPGIHRGTEVELDPEQLQALVLGLPWQRVGADGAITLL